MTRENISLWLQQSEPDYYIFFLKAWIPFNAWYVEEYPLLKKKDTEIIKEIQNTNNSKPKNIIKNLLENSDYDSVKFRSYLAELNYELEKTPVYHNSYRLTFRDLALNENPIKFQHHVDGLGNVYKTEKGSSFFQAYIQAKNSKVLLDFKKPLHNPEELCKDTDYIRLDSKLKKMILRLYIEIDPKKGTSIIASKKENCLLLKSKNPCKVIADTEIVAKACIKLLYSLRCMLFHGELPPSEANKKIYENSYYMLKSLIKGLK